MEKKVKRILLVEDDRLLNQTLAFHLTTVGYEIASSYNIASAKGVLQSIGLSNKQLVRMIQFEGLGLSFGNLIITLIFGTALGYGLIGLLQHFGATYHSCLDGSSVYNMDKKLE